MNVSENQGRISFVVEQLRMRLMIRENHSKSWILAKHSGRRLNDSGRELQIFLFQN